jgi:hypothetical protein
MFDSLLANMANPIDMLLPLMIKVRLFDEVLLVDHDNG